MIMSGVGLWGAAKIAAAGACMVGAWGTFQTLPSPSMKSKMMKCFKAAGIYHNAIVTNSQGSTVKKIYPIVNKVHLSYEKKCVTVIFTIPFGMNPDEVKNKRFVFNQGFGEHVELDHSGRMFTLTVYIEDLLPFAYDFNEVAKLVEEMKLKLPIICGRNRHGWDIFDLFEDPNVLITGIPGSGKSTILRAILTFLIQFFQPDQLHLYLADLKQTEFHLFENVAHVQKYDKRGSAIAVRKPEVHNMLAKIQKDLERRGNLLKQHHVAHINELPEKERPPYVVVCIDEFALLKKEKETMELIEEISTLGRALGVFLILSCQRADRNVVEGFLKNNLTVRMAFRSSDALNSRITLGFDQEGTDAAAYIKPEQKGRMILKRDGFHSVQAPFLDVEEAKKILADFKIEKPKKGDVIDIEAEVEVSEVKEEIVPLKGFD